MKGAPATSSGAITTIMSRCWIMCIQKSRLESISMGAEDARRKVKIAPRK
jgi:hypothetical protein